MTIKHKLLGKNRKLHKKLTLEIGGEKVEVCLYKPTMGDRIRTLEGARAAGELNEKNEPANERAAMLMMARVVAAVLFDPETKQRAFSDNDIPELLDEGWLEDVFEECQAVFSPTMESVQGK